jgi:hypothetical protein
MKSVKSTKKPRLSRDAERVIWLTGKLHESFSRIESTWLEDEIMALTVKLLEANDPEMMDVMADRMSEKDPELFKEFQYLLGAVNQVKTTAEGAYLILAMPIMAWSRYAIPTPQLSASVLDSLRDLMTRHILATGSRVIFANHLLSSNQVPGDPVSAWQLSKALWQSAEVGQDCPVDLPPDPEEISVFIDIRYVYACAFIPKGRPVFRWNELNDGRAQVATRWQKQAAPLIQTVLPGCTFEVLLPDSLSSAQSMVIHDFSVFSVVNAVPYLTETNKLPANKFCAVLGLFGDKLREEWRISFMRIGSNDVLFGVTWHVDPGNEGAEVGTEIEYLLKKAKIGDVIVLDELFSLLYCHGCGAPLYPNLDGENVHAKLSDEMTHSTAPLLH